MLWVGLDAKHFTDIVTSTDQKNHDPNDTYI